MSCNETWTSVNECHFCCFISHDRCMAGILLLGCKMCDRCFPAWLKKQTLISPDMWNNQILFRTTAHLPNRTNVKRLFFLTKSMNNVHWTYTFEYAFTFGFKRKCLIVDNQRRLALRSMNRLNVEFGRSRIFDRFLLRTTNPQSFITTTNILKFFVSLLKGFSKASDMAYHAALLSNRFPWPSRIGPTMLRTYLHNPRNI